MQVTAKNVQLQNNRRYICLQAGIKPLCKVSSSALHNAVDLKLRLLSKYLSTGLKCNSALLACVRDFLYMILQSMVCCSEKHTTLVYQTNVSRRKCTNDVTRVPKDSLHEAWSHGLTCSVRQHDFLGGSAGIELGLGEVLDRVSESFLLLLLLQVYVTNTKPEPSVTSLARKYGCTSPEVCVTNANPQPSVIFFTARLPCTKTHGYHFAKKPSQLMWVTYRLTSVTYRLTSAAPASPSFRHASVCWCRTSSRPSQL